ncbi:MAG TPA: response regulator [Leptolyngbyaceae cyanobacterium]
MSAKRILIVDDEYRIREVIKLTLEMMAGWEVLMADSGAEGLSIAELEQPDAILLDMMMPDMDGTVTLRYLQANLATQQIPVLLLTAKLPIGGEPQFTQLGAKAVIPKPFDPLSLANQIAEILGWELS